MPGIRGFRNRNRRGRCHATNHGVTRFEGFAVVVAPKQVRSAVVEDIGGARTYGCEPLSVVPVPTSGG
jgi:CRISPR system Cascade subunit CasE